MTVSGERLNQPNNPYERFFHELGLAEDYLNMLDAYGHIYQSLTGDEVSEDLRNRLELNRTWATPSQQRLVKEGLLISIFEDLGPIAEARFSPAEIELFYRAGVEGVLRASTQKHSECDVGSVRLSYDDSCNHSQRCPRRVISGYLASPLREPIRAHSLDPYENNPEYTHNAESRRSFALARAEALAKLASIKPQVMANERAGYEALYRLLAENHEATPQTLTDDDLERLIEPSE